MWSYRYFKIMDVFRLFLLLFPPGMIISDQGSWKIRRGLTFGQKLKVQVKKQNEGQLASFSSIFFSWRHPNEIVRLSFGSY